MMFMVIRVVQKKFFGAVPGIYSFGYLFVAILTVFQLGKKLILCFLVVAHAPAENEDGQHQNQDPQNQGEPPQNQDPQNQGGPPQNEDPQNEDGPAQNEDGEIPDAQGLHPLPQNESNEDQEIENAGEKIDIVMVSGAAALDGKTSLQYYHLLGVLLVVSSTRSIQW